MSGWFQCCPTGLSFLTFLPAVALTHPAAAAQWQAGPAPAGHSRMPRLLCVMPQASSQPPCLWHMLLAGAHVLNVCMHAKACPLAHKYVHASVMEGSHGRQAQAVCMNRPLPFIRSADLTFATSAQHSSGRLPKAALCASSVSVLPYLQRCIIRPCHVVSRDQHLHVVCKPLAYRLLAPNPTQFQAQQCCRA